LLITTRNKSRVAQSWKLGEKHLLNFSEVGFWKFQPFLIAFLRGFQGHFKNSASKIALDQRLTVYPADEKKRSKRENSGCIYNFSIITGSHIIH
jgi:hypothetical protein